MYQHLTKQHNHINVGTGTDITIKELSDIIKEVVGFKGEINFDPTKLDGVQRKLLNSRLINDLGWCPEVKLQHGLKETYKNFLNN